IAAVVLDDDVDLVLVAVLALLPQAVGAELDLLLEGAGGVGVDADGVAAEEFGGLDPLVMVLDGGLAFLVVGGAEVALAVAHDQDAADAVVVAALLQLLQILLVAGLVLEELVDVLDGGDVIVLLRDGGEVEVGHLLAEEALVERPLRQRDLEERLL